jgi:hypothetical protein
MTRLQLAGSWAPGVVTWRVSDRKAGFGAASLCALLDLLDDPGAPCLVGEALETYLAYLDCGAGVVGAAREASSALIQAPPPRYPDLRSPHSPHGGSAVRRGPKAW